MAISSNETGKIMVAGGIAGLVTPLLLKYAIMPILSALGQITPTLSAKLANPVINIDVTGSITGVNTGLSQWIYNALGLTLTVPYMTYIMGAIGGALLFLGGAYAADALGMLKGTTGAKTTAMIFSGNAIAAFVIGGFAVPAIGFTLVNALIAFAINAAILSFVFVALDKPTGIGLVPF